MLEYFPCFILVSSSISFFQINNGVALARLSENRPFQSCLLICPIGFLNLIGMGPFRVDPAQQPLHKCLQSRPITKVPRLAAVHVLDFAAPVCLPAAQVF